jgi:hypothetical protein
MKKFSNNILLFAALCLFISCRAYYVPNENSTPMLTHKNNVKFNGGASLGMRASSFAGAIAYAPTNNIGLVYQRSSYTNGGSSSNFNSGNFNEFSVGYFKLFEDNMLFELYLNHGLGKTENSNAEFMSSNYGSYNTKFDKTSINLAIGKVSKNVDFSFYTRIGSLDIHDVIYSNINNTSLLDDLKSIKSKRYLTFIEPGLSAKFGFENVKFYTKGSFSFIDQNYTDLYFQQFQLTFGIQLELNNLK